MEYGKTIGNNYLFRSFSIKQTGNDAFIQSHVERSLSHPVCEMS